MSSLDVAQGVLRDGFSRIAEGVPQVVADLDSEEILWRPDAEANHIAWLVWHLTRQQDEQVAHVAGRPSRWTDGAWADRFALPYPADATGYGMSGADVAAFTLEDPSLLPQYHEAVHAATLEALDSLSVARLGEVLDGSWDPPVTVAVRLVSVIDDAAKHLGQAMYVRGLVRRRRR